VLIVLVRRPQIAPLDRIGLSDAQIVVFIEMAFWKVRA